MYIVAITRSYGYLSGGCCVLVIVSGQPSQLDCWTAEKLRPYLFEITDDTNLLVHCETGLKLLNILTGKYHCLNV